MDYQQVYQFYTRGHRNDDKQLIVDSVITSLQTTVHSVRDRFDEFKRLYLYPHCSAQLRIESTKADLDIEIAIYEALKPFGNVNGFPEAIAAVAATLYDDSFDAYFQARQHLADVSRNVCVNTEANLRQACLPEIIDELSSYEVSPYSSPAFLDDMV